MTVKKAVFLTMLRVVEECAAAAAEEKEYHAYSTFMQRWADTNNMPPKVDQLVEYAFFSCVSFCNQS